MKKEVTSPASWNMLPHDIRTVKFWMKLRMRAMAKKILLNTGNPAGGFYHPDEGHS